MVCSKDTERFFKDGALLGVRDAGVTDSVSRGSVDIALTTKMFMKEFSILNRFDAEHKINY